MASRKNLKKSINNLTFELVSECMAYKHFHQDKKHDDTQKAMENIVLKRNELIDRVNHPKEIADYKKNREYYRTIIKEMNDMVSFMDKLG